MMLRIEFTRELTRRCSSNFTLTGEVFLRTLPPSMSNRVPPGQHESAKEGSARPLAHGRDTLGRTPIGVEHCDCTLAVDSSCLVIQRYIVKIFGELLSHQLSRLAWPLALRLGHRV